MPNLKPTHIEPTEDEDAAIEAGIAVDPDASDGGYSDPRPAGEVHPEMVRQWKRTKGRKNPPAKEIITLRLDSDVLDYFRASGKGWQSRVSDILRQAAFGSPET